MYQQNCYLPVGIIPCTSSKVHSLILALAQTFHCMQYSRYSVPHLHKSAPLFLLENTLRSIVFYIIHILTTGAVHIRGSKTGNIDQPLAATSSHRLGV